MKKKILSILICLLIILSSIIIIDNQNVVAYAENPTSLPLLNTTYIHEIAEHLSNIIYSSYNNTELRKGRYFGTKGEHDAADYLAEEIHEIGLINITNDDDLSYHERIVNDTSNLSHRENTDKFDILSRTFTISNSTSKNRSVDCYLSPRWTLDSPGKKTIPDDKSTLDHWFNYTNLPVYYTPVPFINHLESFFDNLSELIINFLLNLTDDNAEDNISTLFEQYYNFTFSDIEAHPENATRLNWYNETLFGDRTSFVFIEVEKTFNPHYKPIPLDLPHIYFDQLKKRFKTKCIRYFYPSCKAEILYDYDNYSHNNARGDNFRIPKIYINGSEGRNITKDIDDYTVNLSFEQDWSDSVVSYNIIGQINGSNPDPNKIIVINSLYDSWWDQGTADSAIGVGIVMALARYYLDLHITPRYTIQFVLFGGEEAGAKGAYSYRFRHSNQQIVQFIDLNQLGFNQTNPKNILHIGTDKIDLKNTLQKIADGEDYVSRNDNTIGLEIQWKPWGLVSDDMVYAMKILKSNTITFLKDTTWYRHHRDGVNHTQGDSMKYYDARDVAATADLIYNYTKYFCLFPNCTFTSIDSHPWLKDGDDVNTIPDSIQVNYTMKTKLPQDRLWVRTLLVSKDYPVLCRYSIEKPYVVTPDGKTGNINLTLPLRAPQGKYNLTIYLFNSSGIVDCRVHQLKSYFNASKYANVTKPYGEFYLSPPNDPPEIPHQPWGDTQVLTSETSTYTTHTTDPNNDHIWYQWKYEKRIGHTYYTYYTRWIMGGPHASGENCTRKIHWPFPGTYNVSARAKDIIINPNVMGNWSPPLQVTVSKSDNGASWDTDLLNTFTSTTVAVEQQTNCNGLAAGVIVDSTQRGSLNWTWNFGDGTISYGENVSHNYSELGNYIVNLTLRNDQSETSNFTTTISVNILGADFNTTGDEQPEKTVYFNETSIGVYQLVNWSWEFGDGNRSYDRNTSHVYMETGEYSVTLTVRDALNNTHMYTKSVFIESLAPDFVSVIDNPDPMGFENNVMISVDFFDNQSGVKSVKLNITYPDNTTGNFTMEQNVSSEHDYLYVFNDTWQTGVYNYSIWVVDQANNTNYTSGFNFTVSAEANISVTTTKNSYSGNEYINLTDPPGDPSPSLGYELLEDGTVLRLWNQYDSYYFNTSSGIQLTNHKDEYWSHNVMMLGYYNNDQWHLLYRTDELTGFSLAIQTDNTTYVNITLWKDLTYAGYPFRLALRYHLGIDDNDLTIIPSIKNLGTTTIPYVLGFGWELKDIQINTTTEGDYIVVDQESYSLNQTLNNTYTTLNETMFSLMDDSTDTQTQSLYLRWDSDLTYKLQVKSRTGQQNAPVTLFIRIGTLAVGQQKSTLFHWYDASQETYYFNAFDEKGEAWETEPEMMIDESEETFASTSTDNDVELCNGNTCPGENQGTITKVELRVNGYYEGKNTGNITLRPIFDKTDGENYTYIATDKPDWSPWFNITMDGGHGSGPFMVPWSWSEFHTLGCDVEACLGSETTLSCGMVQLRVTYNTAPIVSNPIPLYGTNGITVQPLLNITVSDPDGDSMNVTWYSNSTPSLLTLHPNVNGSSTQLNRYPTSQNANYKCVDETVVDDADYVKWQGISWKNDTYGLPNHTTQSGVIHDVTVSARCARVGYQVGDPPTESAAKIMIKSGGNYYYGSEFKPPYSSGQGSITYSNYSYRWMQNPASDAAWTWSTIDSLEAGIMFIGEEGASRCTQVFVTVNYTDPSTWVLFGGNSSVGNGMYHQRFLNASVNGHWWYWKVKADDGTQSTWSSVYKFYTGYQSKIENTGETNISGYLLMQVQYYDDFSEQWVLDVEVVNQSITQRINVSEQLGLDKFFNGEVQTNDLTHGDGTYRVYAAFRDPDGNILKTDEDVELAAWWQFTKT